MSSGTLNPTLSGSSSVPLIALLGLQFPLGDKPLKFQVVCPRNGTAVQKGLVSPNQSEMFALQGKQSAVPLYRSTGLIVAFRWCTQFWCARPRRRPPPRALRRLRERALAFVAEALLVPTGPRLGALCLPALR